MPKSEELLMRRSLRLLTSTCGRLPGSPLDHTLRPCAGGGRLPARAGAFWLRTVGPHAATRWTSRRAAA